MDIYLHKYSEYHQPHEVLIRRDSSWNTQNGYFEGLLGWKMSANGMILARCSWGRLGDPFQVTILTNTGTYMDAPVIASNDCY